MKKSLSAILSLAMAFSMFASVAMAADATKDSSSFSDLKDLDAATKAKFDEMIKAGIFDGVSDGVFGVKDKMNRAQFAKVAALIFQLKVDTSLKTSTFSDVKADDPANGYALPYIEALVKAGITDGYAPGQFNPAGEVTKEQLATFLIRGLGKDTAAKATPGVSDKTVSDWAKGYVALALQLKLLSSGADGTFGGTSAATRDLLVLGSYEAKKQFVPPAPNTVTNVSITKAEAVGAKSIKLTLNGAIADTSKLNVSVLRGSTALTVASTKWNDTKNEVTVTVDGKFTEGTYTAKIEAVANGGLTVDKGTSDVTVQNETIKKIEFVNASDTIAQGPKVKIAFKAYNQYNEVSDLSASRFNIVTSPDLGAQSAGDEQSIKVNVASAVYKRTLVRDQMFTVTIMAPDNTAQASKSFKVGDTQGVAKIEFGDFKYASGKTQIEAGDTAYLDYKAYDQYGFEVSDLDTLILGTNTYTLGAGTVVSGTEAVTVTDPVTQTPRVFNVNKGFKFVEDETGDSKPDLKITAADIDSSTFQIDQDITFSVTASIGGQTATKSTKIAATKIPYEITFGSFNKTLAWGDDDQFIPIVAKDKFGTALTTDELVSYVQNHPNDILIYGYGSAGVSVDSSIVTSGAHKGSVKISKESLLYNDPSAAVLRKSGSLTINANVTKSGKTATFNSQVNEYRYPNQIYVASKNKDEILPNATSAFQLKFKDQYGEELDTNLQNYDLQLTIQSTNGGVTDAVYAYLDKDSTQIIKSGQPLTIKGNEDGNKLKNLIFGKDIKFTTKKAAGDDNTEGTYQVKATLTKARNFNTGDTNGLNTAISTTTSIDRIKASKANTDLTYSLAAFPNGIYAVGKLVDQLAGTGTPLSKEVESYFYGKLDVQAKDGSKTVALPDNKFLIQNVGVSNQAVAQKGFKAKLDGGLTTFDPSGTVKDNVDVWGLKGLKAGTTSVTVTIAPTTTVTKQITLDNINIVEDGITASSITADEDGKGKTISLSALKTGTLSLFNDDKAGNKTFGDVKVKDQFGNELKNAGLIKAQDIVGVTFYISDIKWKSDIQPNTGSIAITTDKATGKAVYTYTPATGTGGGTVEIDSFKVNISTANGKTVSVTVAPSNP